MSTLRGAGRLPSQACFLLFHCTDVRAVVQLSSSASLDFSVDVIRNQRSAVGLAGTLLCHKVCVRFCVPSPRVAAMLVQFVSVPAKVFLFYVLKFLS